MADQKDSSTDVDKLDKDIAEVEDEKEQFIPITKIPEFCSQVVRTNSGNFLTPEILKFINIVVTYEYINNYLAPSEDTGHPPPPIGPNNDQIVIPRKKLIRILQLCFGFNSEYRKCFCNVLRL